MHLWSTSSNFVRPNASCENAHTKGTETGSIQFDLNGNYIATRGGDGTVKSVSVAPFFEMASDFIFLYFSLGCPTIEEEPVYSIRPPGALSQHERHLEP